MLGGCEYCRDLRNTEPAKDIFIGDEQGELESWFKEASRRYIMNNFTTHANGILVDDKIRCQFCGNKMERKHSMMGAGIVNNYDYWCNCGAVAIFSHRFDKPIKTVTIKYEYE